MIPHTAGDGHDVDHTADGGDAAAQHGGHILVADDVDTGGVGRGGGLTHGAQIQTHAGLFQHHRHDHGHHTAHLGEDVVPEQPRPDHRQLPQCGGEGRIGEGGLQAIAHRDISAGGGTHILADELACAGAEDGQRQTGHVLVCAQGDGDKAVDQRAESARDEGAENGQNDGNNAVGVRSGGHLIVKRTAQTQRAAHVHHALDAQIQVACPFGQDLAHGAEQQGHAVQNGGHQQQDEEAAVYALDPIHHFDAPPFSLCPRKMIL